MTCPTNTKKPQCQYQSSTTIPNVYVHYAFRPRETARTLPITYRIVFRSILEQRQSIDEREKV